MSSHTLHDSILGHCVVTNLCAPFVEAAEHTRLKHIAMHHADVLYPSLVYSRREHCIAVMELARRWASKLSGDARLVDLVALVGLYHDIGHVTLCHTMDDHLHSTTDVPTHETRSALVLQRVNRRLGRPLNPVEEQFVCDAIQGETPTSISPYPLWMYQIVNQPNRLWPDVDRLVYLCHDTYKIGIHSGIDLPRLHASISVDRLTQALHFDPEYQIDLDHIVSLRSHMFANVFWHPITQLYQRSLLHRFCTRYTTERLLQDFQDFSWLALTDTLLWTVVPDVETALYPESGLIDTML
jgi:HD superfamily phosphohydrolase